MSARQSQNEAPKPGLLIAPNWVGDAVMCLPALRALVAARRDLCWQVAARPRVAGVFVAAARAAEIGWETWALPGQPGAGQLRLARRQWRGGRPEMAVVFPNSMYSALLARASGAKRRIGYARDGRRPWLSQPIRVPAPGSTPPHEAFYYLELLRRARLIAGWPDQASALRAPLAPSAAAVRQWRERLAAWPPLPGQARVAIHAGASFGHAKRWLPERFAAVARSLAAGGHAVVFIGSREEAALAEELARAATAGPRQARAGAVVSLAGKTDMEGLLAILSQCQALIANDSGPMHLAAGLGTPVVAIFGSTNARETHPLAAAGNWRLIQAPGVECSPCKLRECPIDHRCMIRIQVGEVTEAARQLLEPRRW